MPIYEYQCPFCDHQLEALQKMSDAPLTECPHCKKQGLVRLVSAAGFQLKGTGWYATDYRNKGKPKETETKTETKEGDKSKTSTDASSDNSKRSKINKPDEGSKSSSSGDTSSGDHKTGDKK